MVNFIPIESYIQFKRNALLIREAFFWDYTVGCLFQQNKVLVLELRALILEMGLILFGLLELIRY